MTYPQATAYGLIQGVTEFLPISSSAHLILAPWAFGWEDPGLTFDVALHMGTLAALLIYFWRDWLGLLRGFFNDPWGKRGRLLWLLGAGTVPGAVAGLLLEKRAETTFRNPTRIAWTLIVFGLLLELADRLGRRQKELESLGPREGLGIGLAQALAIIPGVSRSGITLTAGRGLGLTRDAAARYSFLLATPIIAGAGLLKLRHLAAADVTGPFVLAVAVSALSGLAAAHVLLTSIGTKGLRPYVVYRVLLGFLILAAVR